VHAQSLDESEWGEHARSPLTRQIEQASTSGTNSIGLLGPGLRALAADRPAGIRPPQATLTE
jgi:hypothetical protein